MRRLSAALAATLISLALAAPAQAEFGLGQFDFGFANEDGSPATRAGSHPFAVHNFFEVNYHENEDKPGTYLVDGGDIKDLILESAKGFTGDTTAVPRCTTLEFATIVSGFPDCAEESAVGLIATYLKNPVDPEGVVAPLYNLTPPPGVPVRLGFVVAEVPVTIDVTIKTSPDYNAIAALRNISQPLTVFTGAAEIWGVPADPAHDFLRGQCAPTAFTDFDEAIKDGRLNYEKGIPGNEECSSEAEERPFLTLPRACGGPLATIFELDPWLDPGAWVKGALPVPPFEGCGKLDFLPAISSRATTDSAGGGSGLDFELDFEDEIDHDGEGLIEPDGIAQSDMKKIVVALPEGMTANPSLAEGLGVCTPTELDHETLAAEAGEGCPNASKIGTLHVQTPIVEEAIEGEVFLAQPDDPATATPGAENPFDSLIALHLVFKNKNLGVLVKVPAKVAPDPETGRLVTTVDESPQLPFTRLKFHFREGQRAPLITPPACDTYTTTAEITPWAKPAEVRHEIATFEIVRGVGGGACPLGGIPPFTPGFEAGSLNNAAAAYSPFFMRLTRQDGQQDMTKFSATLPPGVIGKIAGVSKCSEAQIAAARTKTGKQELTAPSCPPNSRIGGTIGGAGVGSSLTYVPGDLYLAGPYKGSLISVVAITPAVAGPFDVGTIVVRVALNVNPRTAEVQVDGSASDPIPHILAGIPLNVRDLRVLTDRPEFTLNPTSCEEEHTRASLFGSFLDVFDPADDVPVPLQARYQAADCASLAYRPRFDLRLKGPVGRGGHPAFHAVFRPRAGHANSEGIVFRFPRSAFLDQAHIRTICTRVQFAADACPKGAIYGRATAYTPLLDEPLTGPVYLRSSDNDLPDVVVDLHGLVDFEAVSRIDSIKGGIRATFTDLPDAPVSKVVVDMQGGKKGLIVNSRDICKGKNRANVQLSGHNGKKARLRPELRGRCGRSARADRRARR